MSHSLCVVNFNQHQFQIKRYPLIVLSFNIQQLINITNTVHTR